MIFLTVGTQLPFDRLVAAVDEIAATLSEPVVAQIGVTQYQPKHLDWHASLSPQQFDGFLSQARLLIAHAGTGTVLAAKRHTKPIIVFPRQSSLGEHRNDHQLATCKHLENTPGVYIAYEPQDLARLIAKNDLVPASDDPDSPRRLALLSNLQAYFTNP